MNAAATLPLAAVAAGIGALHTLAPDHWVPFAALARAEGWSARRTAAVTAACGFGHVTTSVLLAVTSLALGIQVMSTPRGGSTAPCARAFIITSTTCCPPTPTRAAPRTTVTANTMITFIIITTIATIVRWRGGRTRRGRCSFSSRWIRAWR
jgi:hypothetical protein